MKWMDTRPSCLDTFKARIERLSIEEYNRAGGTHSQRTLNKIQLFINNRLNGIEELIEAHKAYLTKYNSTDEIQTYNRPQTAEQLSEMIEDPYTWLTDNNSTEIREQAWYKVRTFLGNVMDSFESIEELTQLSQEYQEDEESYIIQDLLSDTADLSIYDRKRLKIELYDLDILYYSKSNTTFKDTYNRAVRDYLKYDIQAPQDDIQHWMKFFEAVYKIAVEDLTTDNAYYADIARMADKF